MQTEVVQGRFLVAIVLCATICGCAANRPQQRELTLEENTTELHGWIAGNAEKMLFPNRDHRSYSPYDKKEAEKCVTLLGEEVGLQSDLVKFDSKEVIVTGIAKKYASLADGTSSSDVLLSKKYFKDRMVENFCLREYVFVVSSVRIK